MQNRPIDFHVTQKVHWHAFRCHTANNPKNLTSFRVICSVASDNQLSEKAIKICFNFPTTYICKAGFISCSSMKTFQNRLKAEADMRT